MSTGRKVTQGEFTAINVHDPIDVTKSQGAAGLQIDSSSSSPPQPSTCKEKCMQSVDTLVSEVADLLDKADLQNSSVDSRDLHKYKAKIPILFLYVAAFVASFAGLFSYSYTTDMSTKFLSPKDPKAADKPNCKSDQIAINGAYLIDTNGNWQGTGAFQDSRVAYEVKFQDFRGSYDDWKTITDEFVKDLYRVRDTSRGLRNGRGDLAYSLLIPASYSFFKQMPTGSVQIYLRADASYLFNNYYDFSAQGSMTGYQKNNTETPCLSTDEPCSKFGKLSVVASGEIDTSYDVTKGGILTFAVPTFKTSNRSILPNFEDDDDVDTVVNDDGLRVQNDDPNWDDQNPNEDGKDPYIVTLPASSFLSNLMHQYDKISNMKDARGDGVDEIKFHYDMRSVATALAVNNGLASLESLKSLGPVDVASMDPEDFFEQFIHGEDNIIQLGMYTDPYYVGMEPILCLSAPFIHDILHKFREYIVEKYPSRLDIFDAKYMVYLDVLVNEIESNDRRNICFVKSTLEFHEAPEVFLSFWSFPTMNQMGSWSDKEYIPDDFVDDYDAKPTYFSTDIKDECWYPAYGRYDGLYPHRRDNRPSYSKFTSYMNFRYGGGMNVLISFLHLRSNPRSQIFDIFSCTKLMHEMLSSYSTMEERFYSLYTENAATAGLNMLTRAPARGHANLNFKTHLYEKWMNENEIEYSTDPLNYKFGYSRQSEGSMDVNEATKYGLRDIAASKYLSLEDIKEREDLFLSDELYGDNLMDGSNYYVQFPFSASNTNDATQDFVTAGPYYVCPSRNGNDLRFTMSSNGGFYTGNVVMMLFDDNGGPLVSYTCTHPYGCELNYENIDSACKNVYLRLGCKGIESCLGTVAIFRLRQPTMSPTTAPTLLSSGKKRVGFYDFLSNNENLVLDLGTQNTNDDNLLTISNTGNPDLPGCPSKYSNIMTRMFEKFADSHHNSFAFTTSVIMTTKNTLKKDMKNTISIDNLDDIIYAKAIKNIVEPPVQLSQSYETCTKSANSAIVNSLGVAFSNAKLISDVVLMISLFAAVYILNKYVIVSKAQKLISPDNKSKLFRMTTSLAIQRMMKLGPKDYSNDDELKNIVHTLHVYDEMLDEEENFDHIRSTLSVLGVEMDATPDDDDEVKVADGNAASGNSEKLNTSTSVTSATDDKSSKRLAELEATIAKLVQRISYLEESKDSS